MDTLPVTESVETEVDVFVTEGDELIVVLTEPVFETLVVPVPLLVPVELRDDVVLRVTVVLAVDVPHMVVDTLELVHPDFSVLADILVDDDDEKDGALVNELAGEEDSSAETETDPLADTVSLGTVDLEILAVCVTVTVRVCVQVRTRVAVPVKVFGAEYDALLVALLDICGLREELVEPVVVFVGRGELVTVILRYIVRVLRTVVLCVGEPEEVLLCSGLPVKVVEPEEDLDTRGDSVLVAETSALTDLPPEKELFADADADAVAVLERVGLVVALGECESVAELV